MVEKIRIDIADDGSGGGLLLSLLPGSIGRPPILKRAVETRTIMLETAEEKAAGLVRNHQKDDHEHLDRSQLIFKIYFKCKLYQQLTMSRLSCDFAVSICAVQVVRLGLFPFYFIRRRWR